MTSDPTSTHPLRRLDALAPEQIEQRLGRLIRHYLRTRSPAIALSVVRHIETLCAHPGFEGGTAERCAYLRLRRHWRWLAISREHGMQGA